MLQKKQIKRKKIDQNYEVVTRRLRLLQKTVSSNDTFVMLAGRTVLAYEKYD